MKIVPTWEILDEGQKLVVTLCDMYPEKLGHVTPDKIGVAVITNKDKTETQEWDARMVGVTAPASLFSSKMYIIYMNKNTWDNYSPAQRSAMLMYNLLKIPDPMDGSMVKEDLKDHKCMVKAWGVDYIDNPALPDLATTKQTF